MSVTITFKVDGLDEIHRAFQQAPAKVAVEIGKAVGRSIALVENSAKRKAPVNKRGHGGTLRQSIRSRMTGIASGLVEVGANYAIFVHEGTRPHIIRVRNKKVLADKRSGSIFGKVVRHPGTKAQPFLQEAVDQNSAAMNQEFMDALKRVV